jgi:hypothetical protein
MTPNNNLCPENIFVKLICKTCKIIDIYRLRLRLTGTYDFLPLPPPKGDIA